MRAGGRVNYSSCFTSEQRSSALSTGHKRKDFGHPGLVGTSLFHKLTTELGMIHHVLRGCPAQGWQGQLSAVKATTESRAWGKLGRAGPAARSMLGAGASLAMGGRRIWQCWYYQTFRKTPSKSTTSVTAGEKMDVTEKISR